IVRLRLIRSDVAEARELLFERSDAALEVEDVGMIARVRFPRSLQLLAPCVELSAQLLGEVRLVHRARRQSRDLAAQRDDVGMVLAIAALQANQLLLRGREPIDAAEDRLAGRVHYRPKARRFRDLALEHGQALSRLP